jgi:hypothetical protein
MNIVYRYIQKQYIPLIENFVKKRGENLSQFRSRLMRECNCQSVAYQTRPGAPSIWTLRVKGMILIYKYDLKEGKAICMGVK